MPAFASMTTYQLLAGRNIQDGGPYKSDATGAEPEWRLGKQTGTGMPNYFTVTDSIEFDIAPDSAYAYELLYYPTFPALSDSQTTNWVLTNYPDVYLAGCLYWANRFTQNEQEATNWMSQYKQAAWTASETYRRSTLTQGSIAIRPDNQ